jgi:hypothetical protein
MELNAEAEPAEAAELLCEDALPCGTEPEEEDTEDCGMEPMDGGGGMEPEEKDMDDCGMEPMDGGGGMDPEEEDTDAVETDPDSEDALVGDAEPDCETVSACCVFCFLGVFNPACMGAATGAAPTGESDAEGGATVCPAAAISPSRSAFASRA